MTAFLTTFTIIIAAASAFSSPSFLVRPPSMSASLSFFQLNAMEDNAKAIEAALEASKKYGKTSQEARVAWDIVEELDAATSHAKEAAAATTVAASGTKMDTMSTTDGLVAITSRAEALADAKKITEEKGIQSKEARLAWELVEELAASEYHHNTMGSG